MTTDTAKVYVKSFACTECPHVFTEAEVAAEDKSTWGHPCHGVANQPVATCESFRKPVFPETRVAETPAPQPPDLKDSLDRLLAGHKKSSTEEWVTVGTIKVDPETETETFERAAPAPQGAHAEGELLPCPSGDADEPHVPKLRSREHSIGRHGEEITLWFVECECGFRGPEDSVKADAIRKWNTRTVPVPPDSFQARVHPWLTECFGVEIANDKQERNHRFLEEALELVQSCSATRSEAHQLVDYVYDRPAGESYQEAGGVMVTLAALCLANNLDMHDAGETELARIWTKVEQIRAKQAAKPRNSPLPERVPPDMEQRARRAAALTPEIAYRLLQLRDALIQNDLTEAYHWLYKLADPDIESLTPWAELESLAESFTEAEGE